MAILQEIPLQAIANQQLTVNINNQTFNITLKSITVNNKPLQDNTPAYEPNDQIIGGELVLKSSVFLMADIKLGDVPIIYNVFCNNACYLNPFTSPIIGYLFFYKDGWTGKNDKIDYINFGTNGNTHLYYSDYDALQTTFLSFVNENRKTLEQTYQYGYPR